MAQQVQPHYGDYIYEYRTVRPGQLSCPVVRVMPDGRVSTRKSFVVEDGVAG